MRGFIAALLIFGLLICGIILNCTYITNTCETLQEKISALSGKLGRLKGVKVKSAVSDIEVE